MNPPIIATVESLLGYLEWHAQCGRGQQPVVFDRRGLDYLKPNKHETVGVGLPPPDETHGNHAVYLRAVF